ncbi:hypothetical protein [Saccharopolyspora flava]|uniref:Uncharacterized protein n=1 Tax=Saccharopolyspora flava TaxID=95161 RepID=A0A1I6SRW4_9PSEU|nr:hypothetical protein [Saccharopolyspora flava]SFS79609.1 hypothetical protein SAMN05660874_03351 [Saccharopolyspora flava]
MNRRRTTSVDGTPPASPRPPEPLPDPARVLEADAETSAKWVRTYPGRNERG